ncbi:MAG: TolC family protein, partial [Bacteroidetes bacterium]|nr:TolC family protein [Bacteroidota bacterium]
MLGFLDVGAQEAAATMPIDLVMVMKLTGADNLIIQEYQQRHQEALAEYSKAKEWWLPTVVGGASTHLLNGAAMNTDGRIFTDIKRNNLWSGFGFAAEWDFAKGMYQTRAAEQRGEGIKHQSIAAKNQTILRAIHAYYEMLAEQMQYAALSEMVARSDSVVQQMRVQVEAGLIFKSELLLAQVNHSHLRIALLQSQTELKTKSSLLVNILNLQDEIQLVSSESEIVPAKIVEDIGEISIETAFEKRPEYFSLLSGLNSIKTERQLTTTGLFIPRIRLATFGGMFGETATPLYFTNELNVSLMWQIPLGRLFYAGDLKKYDNRLLLQQNSIEQFKNLARQETSQSRAQVEIAEEQLNIAKEALQLSAEALDQSMERQRIGTAQALEVFQAQEFFLQARVDYINTISGYNKAQ